MPSTSGSSTKAISSQYTEKTTIESSIKQKKFDEFNDLLTKYIKSNANTQSILEKILEEQLRQRTTIEVIEKSNTKLKCEIFENRKLIQEIFTNFTVGPLNTEQTQQEGKALMTEACHKLFQTNKNPSDAEIERCHPVCHPASHTDFSIYISHIWALKSLVSDFLNIQAILGLPNKPHSGES
ncbi:uncharacterized protein OCT59_001551 [Rhizophagus irregularis]|uniref:uncharacterized protein n=1 Tax=Rhizophagus irregularis TaxID=588596 RepID=UPI0033189216|nr:hypothetical protein OCT59_001551 [Rhizophagus irregularis]